MTEGWKRGLVVLVLAAAMLGLGGCVTPAEQLRSPAILRAALEWNEEGGRLFGEGDLAGAEEAYAEALRLHQSIDQPEGILRNLANLAVVNWRLGQERQAWDMLEAARRYEAMLVAGGGAEMGERGTREVLVEVEILRARILRREGDREGAWLSVVRAGELAAGGRRELVGEVVLLRSALLLDEGRAGEAAWEGGRAVAMLRRGRGGGRELEALADALRAYGRAQLAAGDGQGARRAFGEALGHDRAAARPGQVVESLLGLAESAWLVGDEEGAWASAERALASAEAGGDEARAARARRLLER
jgi:tetratricopeptide (TPR) repeat protein